VASYGKDVSGWSDPGGFVASVAVVCPACAEDFEGEDLTHEEWASLGNVGARCVVCGAVWHAWPVVKPSES
jgi:uncharacterized Zn finger protein